MRGVVLETGSAAAPADVPVAEAQRLFDDTVAFWQDWVGQSTYTGRWREQLQRSAITLKLMTHAPSGGLVAAPTAGLPEQIGGERNWDYRYTWVRDASFSVLRAVRMGFVEEAAAFGGVAARPRGRTGGQRHRAAEHHVPDRRRPPISRGDPRRTGRATGAPTRSGSATVQPGSCSWTSTARRWTASGTPTATASSSVTRAGWPSASCSTGSSDNWDQPEEGIWETRGGRKDFTYGRLMCWVALRPRHPAGDRARPAGTDSPGGRPSATPSTSRS